MLSFVKNIYEAIVSTDNVVNPTLLNDTILRENHEKLSEQCKKYDESHTQNAVNNVDEYEKSNCIKLVGLVTALEANHGVINDNVCFELSAAKEVVGQLSVGCKISYLAYRSDETMKVKAITAITSETWEVPSVNQVFIYLFFCLVQIYKPKRSLFLPTFFY